MWPVKGCVIEQVLESILPDNLNLGIGFVDFFAVTSIPSGVISNDSGLGTSLVVLGHSTKKSRTSCKLRPNSVPERSAVIKY